MTDSFPSGNGTTILAIDIGTQSVRAAALDFSGHILTIAARDLELEGDVRTGFIEQDGMDIVIKTREVIGEILANGFEVDSAGLAIQRSTVIAWDADTGQPLYRAISWQDTREADFVASLSPWADEIQATSGLVLSPHYGASKIRWLQRKLREENPPGESGEGSLRIAPLVSFVLFHLLESRPFLCDESNAARTQLWDLEARCWSESLCALFDVNSEALPGVKPVIGDYGKIRGTNISLSAVCGDQNAAYRAQRQLIVARQGQTSDAAVVNLGTGAFILTDIAAGVAPGRLLKSLALSDNKQCVYLLEGTVNGAGSALEWAYDRWRNERQTAGARDGFDRGDFFRQLDVWWKEFKTPPVFINAVGGVGSPYWYSGLQSVFIGQEESGWDAKTVAVLESILFLLVINLEAMKSSGKALTSLYCSGGLSRMESFCRNLANLSAMEVVRVDQAEATLIGIAILAQSGEDGSGFDAGTCEVGAYEVGTYKVFVPSTNRHMSGMPERYSRFKHYMEGITE